MKDWFYLLFFLGLFIFFKGLIIYLIVKVISDLGLAGFKIRLSQLDKKTNFHYYDRPDIYFDYAQGQWIYKSGYPKEL